jgi:hypothetical protein
LIDNDPPPQALIAQTDRDHRLYRLQAEWRLFPAARKAIESDIAKHPEWGIAVRDDELVRAIPGRPIAQPPSTTRRELSNYATGNRPESCNETHPKSNLNRLKQLA